MEDFDTFAEDFSWQYLRKKCKICSNWRGDTALQMKREETS